ncbi:MAG: hypothetical protein ABRQ37_17225 [Candidatus Eremiobacterota bacterium]
MNFNSINLEKTEFLIDLDRNMFLVPEELLKDYRIDIDEKKIFSEKIGPSEGKTYEYDTVFTFNSNGVYELPCKIASAHVLDNQMRQNVTDYIYNKKWSHIKPSEVNMIGLFLYDFVRTDNQHGADVTGYQAGMVPNYGFNMNYSASGMRMSSYSRESELSQIATGYSRCNNIEAPLNALAYGGDNLCLSRGAQQILNGDMGAESAGYSPESNIGSTLQNLMMQQTFNDLMLQQALQGIVSGGIGGTGGSYGATGDTGETAEAQSDETGETDETEETDESGETDETGEADEAEKAGGDSWLWNESGGAEGEES